MSLFAADKQATDRVKTVTDTIMKLQEFANMMQRLEVDSVEYAYLKTLSLFSIGESHLLPTIIFLSGVLTTST